MKGSWLVFFMIFTLIGALSSCNPDDEAPTSDYGGSMDDDSGNDDETWLYQLQNFNPAAAASTGFDIVVIDYSSDGSEDGEWAPDELQILSDAGKTALAYFSIGQAEDYRFYWDHDWLANPPDWLGPENPDWGGNFEVRYWMEDWKDILFEYLDRIIHMGFDGMYLDIVDGYFYWEESGERPEAEADMVELVIELAQYAREKVAGFMVFPQNGAELVVHDDFLAVIDGVGAEDTWYDGNDLQDSYHTNLVLPFLDKVVDKGKLVLAIDYCRSPGLVEDFYQKCWNRGYLPYSSVRDLDELVVNPGLDN